MSGVLDSSKLPPEILILLSDINNYEDMEYDHVYRVLTSMTPETRHLFDEEAVNRIHPQGGGGGSGGGGAGAGVPPAPNTCG